MALFEELGLRAGFSTLEHEALLNIYFTATLIRKKADRFFRDYGITDVQFNVLSLLRYQSGESGGLNQAELSRMLLVNRANVTSLVDRMERDGFVVREDDPDDRRSNIIKITDPGEELLDTIEGPYLDEVKNIMSPLKKKEMKEMNASMERVRGNLL